MACFVGLSIHFGGEISAIVLHDVLISLKLKQKTADLRGPSSEIGDLFQSVPFIPPVRRLSCVFEEMAS